MASYEVLETPRGDIAYDYHMGDHGAPVVLFVHGLAADMNGDKITAWIPKLKNQGYGVLRLDLNGHGVSYGDLENFKIGHAVIDICDLLDELKLEKVLLLASSVGAWAGMLVAKKRPEIKGVIALAPAVNAMDEVFLKPQLACNPALEADWQAKGYLVTQHFVPGRKLKLPYDMVVDARKHDLLKADVLAKIQQPVIIIHGMDDDVVPLDLSKRLVAGLPNAQLKQLVGVDHQLASGLVFKLVNFHLGEMYRN